MIELLLKLLIKLLLLLLVLIKVFIQWIGGFGSNEGLGESLNREPAKYGEHSYWDAFEMFIENHSFDLFIVLKLLGNDCESVCVDNGFIEILNDVEYGWIKLSP